MRALEAAIPPLAAEKASIQTRLPSLAKVSWVDDVITLLTPVVWAGWGLLWKMGVLAVSSVWVVGISRVIGGVILFKTTGRRIHIRLLTAKIEDRIARVKQIDEIIHTFEKIEEKMHTSETMALRSDTTALRSEMNAVADKLTKLEDENVELKKTMKEILEAIRGKQS